MAIVDWLESNVDSSIKYTGNHKEVHFNCVVCGESRHRMFVNLGSGKVYCHNCGYSSNIVGLMQYVEGISHDKALELFKDINGNASLPELISKDTINDIFIGDLRNQLDKRAIRLPDEYIPIDINTKNIMVKRAIKYLHSRSITNKQILQHKIGFCMDGEYRNRVIIPIYESGELKFWVARAIHRDVKMKEKSPSDEDYQISKSEVIFNIDTAAKQYHSCVICEGIFDALSYGNVGVSLLGKSLYKEQLNILLGYRELLTDGVYISLDNDAKKDALKIASKLSEYFKVYIVNIPSELDDPNNVLMTKGVKYLYSLLENAEEYEEFTSIRSRFL
jgi:gp21.95